MITMLATPSKYSSSVAINSSGPARCIVVVKPSMSVNIEVDSRRSACDCTKVGLSDEGADARRREMLFEPMSHERFPLARQRKGSAGCHSEHQHGHDGRGQHINEAIREFQLGDCGDPQKRDC